MHLSRATEYGLIGMAALARAGGSASVSEIAHDERLALAFLRKIFQRLAEAGLVIARRGSGYTLALPADVITARDVFEAVEGPLAIRDCADGETRCSLAKRCRLVPVWTRVERVLAAELAKIKLIDI